MYNPLLEDLTTLKDSELDSKLSELYKKHGYALKSGNGALVGQIITVIEAYRYEMSRRQAEAKKKMQDKNNTDLDGLINVG